MLAGCLRTGIDEEDVKLDLPDLSYAGLLSLQGMEVVHASEWTPCVYVTPYLSHGCRNEE